MPTYETILFGNGLTTSLFNRIRQQKLIRKSDEKLLKLNERVCSMIGAPVDSPNYREVLKLFGVFGRDIPNYQQIIDEQKAAKRALIPFIPEIQKYGMEYFVGKHLFADKEHNRPVKDNFTFLYLFYNFWYREIEDSIITKPAVKDYLEEVGYEFSTQFKNILSLNFDLLLDNVYMSRPLTVQHIHGRFVEKLGNYGDLQYFPFDDGKQFEYPYLFGSNAFEKQSRLMRIHTNECDVPSRLYDLDFFFDEEKNWKNLLIYGVSFSPTAIFTDEFFAAFPKYLETPGDMKYYFTNSLDGHILYRIQELIERGKINHVYIAYYSERDRSLYERLLDKTLIYEHLSLIQCNDIRFFPNLKNLLGLSNSNNDE
ncbi:hypothetical protein [uncultured Sphaerochaeta sp.]|uniref:hypothetical protein n=1 Tax=uncultured Sphaerochaeta sp. TaxID=886478 RepID=UPI002A0A94EC|nr:hypothetical protein [uncultured Sphaerochaeta sp.]